MDQYTKILESLLIKASPKRVKEELEKEIAETQERLSIMRRVLAKVNKTKDSIDEDGIEVVEKL